MAGESWLTMVGTRKGAFLLKADKKRQRWQLTGPAMLGHIVHHLVLDPRGRRTMLMACKTGHLGPTVFRSTNLGKTWTEAVKPPAFEKETGETPGLAVDHVFWLTPGHPSEPAVWWAGTSVPGRRPCQSREPTDLFPTGTWISAICWSGVFDRRTAR